MKTFNKLISEKLIINKDTKIHYKYFPKKKVDLIELLRERINKEGNDCDLNDIDVSEITDMSYIFFGPKLRKFNGDISNWDVSNVKNMEKMFAYSAFNGDISEWDVSNVEDMNAMFCHSFFTGDISNWDVSKVENMWAMFENSKFNQDISKWKINNKCSINDIFYNSPLQGKEKEWWGRTK